MAPKRVIVSVITVESVDCFFVMDDALAVLEAELQEEIQKIAKIQKKPAIVQVGKVYFAMKEGSWRRARVTAIISENKCKIELIDFGKSDVVSECDLRNVENNFIAELKPKVMKCVLDIPPNHPINKSEWKDDALKFMVADRRKFILHLSRFDENDTLVVDLETTDLVRNYTVIEFLACITGVAVNPAPCATPAEALTIRNQKFESPAVIEVVSIVSPSEFHFALADLKADWFVMSLELQEFYKTNDVKFVLLVPGAFCVTQDETGNWWRVEVIKTPNAQGWCKVHFIDNGNYELVMWHALYELDKQFYDFPRYSTACSLKDVEPTTERWLPTSTNFFRKCVQGVEYKIELDLEDDAGIIHIFPNGVKINLNNLIVEFGFANRFQNMSFGLLFEADPDAVETSCSKKLHRIELINRKSFIPTEFHIRYFDYITAFNIIEEWAQTRAMIPKRHNWKVGDKCLIFCSIKGQAKRYLRGVVADLKNAEIALVTLSDHGSMIQIEAPVKKLAVGPQILEEVGSSVVPVQLACDTMAEWTDEEKQAVTTLLKSYESLYITFKDNNSYLFSTSSKPRPVILWGQQENGLRQNVITVLEDMNLSVKSRFAEKSELHLERKDWSVMDFCREAQQLSSEDVTAKHYQLEDESEAEVGKWTVSLKKRIVDAWLPATPIDRKNFIAIASYVDNNGIVSLRNIFLNNDLTKLNDLINYYFSGIPDNKHQFKVGDPCMVLFDNDALYYRGKILEIRDNKADVEFIDYGNIQRGVETRRLYEKVIGAEIPAFALRYRLQGSPYKSPGNTEWQDKLHAHIVDKSIEVRVLNRDMDCPGIKRCEILLRGITVKFYEDVEEAVISDVDFIEV